MQIPPILRGPILYSLVLVLMPALVVFPSRLTGQEEAIPVLRGQVRLGDDPLPNVRVVLHRVTEGASGEIDSVRADPDGSFRIRLPHVPDHASRPEIFFGSVEYHGLLYFGDAITEAVQLDSLYTIQAFDTLSVPPGGASLPLSARNLFLEKTGSGWTVTDVFQLRHEGEKTLYSPEEGVVWTYPLPPGSSDFQLGQADMAPDAVRFSQGRMEVYSPLPPGERYLMIRYRMPEAEFVVPLPGRTGSVEVLVREPAPPAEFYPLEPAPPLEMEPGNAFRRYSGSNLVDGEIRAEVAPEPWSFPAEWLALLMAGLLGAAGVVGYRRRRREASAEPGPPGPATREDLLLAIATLDESYARKDQPTEEEASRYRAERRRLLVELKQRS